MVEAGGKFEPKPESVARREQTRPLRKSGRGLPNTIGNLL